jgi:putative sterol carrier protein
VEFTVSSTTSSGVSSPGRQAPDPASISAEQFARLVAAWGDDALIAEGLRAVGIERVLDAVFAQMADRFRPQRAKRTKADIQWRITCHGEEYAYVVRLAKGACQAFAGTSAKPRVIFATDLAAFARLITGQAGPVELVTSRRLRVSGSLLFARRVPGLFRMPGQASAQTASQSSEQRLGQLSDEAAGQTSEGDSG